MVSMMVGESGSKRTLVVPSAAVQMTGNHSVVYLVDPTQPGRFTERDVRLGARAGDRMEVLSGLNVGDVVVAKGSFLVRAERERLGLRSNSKAIGPMSAWIRHRPKPRESWSVMMGTTPRISRFAGTCRRLTFVRTSEMTCGTEVVIPPSAIKCAHPFANPLWSSSRQKEPAFGNGMRIFGGSQGYTVDS